MENMVNPENGRPLMSSAELQEGIACLSRGAYFKEAPLHMMLSILTESAARMTGVGRVSIWALDNDQRELLCLDVFALSTQRHDKGERISSGQYPDYFAALLAGNSVVAADAYTHEATGAFADDYLRRHGVTATLDTPIHIRGELQGVLCLEQVGEAQPWTSECALFAQAVANLVTVALVQHEAEEARHQARLASDRLKVVFAAAREGRGAAGVSLGVFR